AAKEWARERQGPGARHAPTPAERASAHGYLPSDRWQRARASHRSPDGDRAAREVDARWCWRRGPTAAPDQTRSTARPLPARSAPQREWGRPARQTSWRPLSPAAQPTPAASAPFPNGLPSLYHILL